MIDRMLSREEVAGIVGVSPSMLSEMVKDGRFPRPIEFGKSSRTHRWPQSMVEKWLAQQAGLTYGNNPLGVRSDTGNTSKNDHFHPIPDIARFFGTSAKRVFEILIDAGLIQEGADDYSRYRPTDDAFKRGLFWRVEKYLHQEDKLYYQTVVTPFGKDTVVDLVRQNLRSGKKREQSGGRRWTRP